MANWRATHAEENQREGETSSITTESDVRYETTRSDTHYEMKWRMIPAMKSSLKATHPLKGNSKEVSHSRANGFQNMRKDSVRSLGHAQRRKPEWHTKNASIYALSGHEHVEKRSDK